jgi:hypothetical protein
LPNGGLSISFFQHLIPVSGSRKSARDRRSARSILETLFRSVPVPLQHLRGSGTTRRAPNRNPTERHSRAASGVPEAARRRLISAREGCWGKTTRSKSFSIQLMIPVRTSPDPCLSSLAVRPGLLPKRRHRRSLLQTRPRESLPERRWRKHGSTSLVYRYLPPRSNLPPRKARPSRERPAAWRRRSPARPPRTRSAQCRERINLLPAIDAQNRSADEKQRHIGADLGGELQTACEQILKGRSAQLFFQSDERRDSVARPGAEPTLHRKSFIDMDFNLPPGLQAAPKPGKQSSRQYLSCRSARASRSS